MHNVSAAYKDWILTNPSIREFHIRASIVTPSGTVSLTDADFIMGGLDISESLTSGDTVEIGLASMSEMTLTVYNNRAEYDTMQMRGSRVFVEIGYVLEDTSTEWVPMGRYIVTESTIPDSTITLRCVDYMLLFQRPWTDVNLTFPATIGDIIDAVCLACAITSVDLTGLPNIDYSVTYDFLTYSNVTCRDVIAYCAQVCGTNARMTRDGLLKLVWYGDIRQVNGAVTYDGNTDTLDGGTTDDLNQIVYDAGYLNQTAPDYTLTASHYERFSRDSGMVVLSGLSYTNEEQTYAVGGDRYALQLEVNPLIQENVETCFATIWDAIGYLAYTPYTAPVFCDPARQAGDLVTFVAKDGTVYNTIATRVTHRFRGRQELRAVGRAQEMTDWQSPTAKALSQLLVKQREETVRLTTYEQRMVQFGELVINSTGLYRSEEVQLDGSIIYYQHDAPLLEDSTYVWKQTAQTFTVSDDGGVSWHGLDAAGNVLARVLTAIGINADWINAGSIDADRIAANSITADKINVTNLIAMKLTNDVDLSAWITAVPYQNWAMLSAYDTDYSSVNPVWSIYGSGLTPFLNIALKGVGVFNVSPGYFWAGLATEGSQFNIFSQTAEGGAQNWGMGLNGHGSVTGDSTCIEISFGNNKCGVDATGVYKNIGGTKTYL